MARVAEVQKSPASVEAETWAPQAHARALALGERSEQALAAGDSESAALLAEHALAAHEHAWVLARLARAERRRLDAEAELTEQRRVLDDLRSQHQRLAAEAAGLELRAQVVRGALPLPPHEAGAPERQEARRRAAAALSTQARLLCVAARLLGETERVSGAITRLDELDRTLASGSVSKQLEVAAELRAECLRVISDVRRQNVSPAARSDAPRGAVTPSASDAAAAAPTPAAPAPAAPAPAAGASAAASAPSTSAAPAAPGTAVAVASASAPLPADVLLDELSAAGTSPSRDDRGVTVSLHDVLGSDGNLTPAARAELSQVAALAAAHPDFPVLLVGHSGSARARGDVDRQLSAVSQALSGAGVAHVEVQAVGDSQPLVSPRSPAARERNQRIELVFVAPGF